MLHLYEHDDLVRIYTFPHRSYANVAWENLPFQYVLHIGEPKLNVEVFNFWYCLRHVHMEALEGMVHQLEPRTLVSQNL